MCGGRDKKGIAPEDKESPGNNMVREGLCMTLGNVIALVCDEK